MSWEFKESELDSSVNFIRSFNKSVTECRLVQREDHQLVVYLSSHNGCKMSCRFCHLTATRQTEMDDVALSGFVDQAKIVLDYWRKNRFTGRERVVNFNFMARGEPLANRFILENWEFVSLCLSLICEKYDLTPVFNISTIIPKTMKIPLETVFRERLPRIYWSLYSTDEKFRKRWLPKAMEPNLAARKINNFREHGGHVVIHNAFIAGQNDSDEDIHNLLKFIDYNALADCDYNIVAYNPASSRHGKETDRTKEIYDTLSNYMTGRVQIIPRVGFDVNASCGMFVS